MPRGDGRGPMGLGSRTGRGAGYCAGFNRPGFMNPVGAFGARRGGFGLGRGLGRGRGIGRGRGWCWQALPYEYDDGLSQVYSGISQEDEKIMLNNEIKSLRSQLARMEKRLKEVDEAPES